MGRLLQQYYGSSNYYQSLQIAQHVEQFSLSLFNYRTIDTYQNIGLYNHRQLLQEDALPQPTSIDPDSLPEVNEYSDDDTIPPLRMSRGRTEPPGRGPQGKCGEVLIITLTEEILQDISAQIPQLSELLQRELEFSADGRQIGYKSQASPPSFTPVVTIPPSLPYAGLPGTKVISQGIFQAPMLYYLGKGSTTLGAFLPDAATLDPPPGKALVLGPQGRSVGYIGSAQVYIKLENFPPDFPFQGEPDTVVRDEAGEPQDFQIVFIVGGGKDTGPCAEGVKPFSPRGRPPMALDGPADSTLDEAPGRRVAQGGDFPGNGAAGRGLGVSERRAPGLLASLEQQGRSGGGQGVLNDETPLLAPSSQIGASPSTVEEVVQRAPDGGVQDSVSGSIAGSFSPASPQISQSPTTEPQAVVNRAGGTLGLNAGGEPGSPPPFTNIPEQLGGQGGALPTAQDNLPTPAAESHSGALTGGGLGARSGESALGLGSMPRDQAAPAAQADEVMQASGGGLEAAPNTQDTQAAPELGSMTSGTPQVGPSSASEQPQGDADNGEARLESSEGAGAPQPATAPNRRDEGGEDGNDPPDHKNGQRFSFGSSPGSQVMRYWWRRFAPQARKYWAAKHKRTLSPGSEAGDNSQGSEKDEDKLDSTSPPGWGNDGGKESMAASNSDKDSPEGELGAWPSWPSAQGKPEQLSQGGSFPAGQPFKPYGFGTIPNGQTGIGNGQEVPSGGWQQPRGGAGGALQDGSGKAEPFSQHGKASYGGDSQSSAGLQSMGGETASGGLVQVGVGGASLVDANINLGDSISVAVG